MNHIPHPIYEGLLQTVLNDYRKNYNTTSNVEVFFTDLKCFNNKSVIGVRDSSTNSLLKLVLVLMTYDDILLEYNTGSASEFGKIVRICEDDVTKIYHLVVQIDIDTKNIIESTEVVISGHFRKSKPWTIS